MQMLLGAKRILESWKSSAGWLVQWLLVFKVCYLLCLVSAVLLCPVGQDTKMFHSKRQRWTAAGQLTFDSHFTSWDAEHYLYLSERGYKAESPATAFYPLWPLLVRFFSIITGGSQVLAGMVLSNLISLAGLVVFGRMVAKRFGESTAWRAVAFLVLFPGALFFQFIYSESLFFLLLMLLWFGLEEDRFWLALVAGALLPLTRAVGILCFFPILLHLVIQSPPNWIIRWNRRSRWGSWIIRLFDKERNRAPDADTGMASPSEAAHYWLLVAPLWGWSLYFLLMWKWTGNPFEGFEAQKYWGIQSMGNLIDLPKFVIGLLNPTVWHEIVGSVLDRCVFVFVLWWLPLIWRLDKVWFAWAVVLGVVPAMSGTFCSYTRFASVVFPLFIAMAVFLGKPERKWSRRLILMVFAILHLTLLWRFVTYRWAG